MAGIRISIPRFVVGARNSLRWSAFKEKANAWMLSKNGENALIALGTMLVCWLILLVIFRNLPPIN
jgi:hypothetical protein